MSGLHADPAARNRCSFVSEVSCNIGADFKKHNDVGLTEIIEKGSEVVMHRCRHGSLFEASELELPASHPSHFKGGVSMRLVTLHAVTLGSLTWKPWKRMQYNIDSQVAGGY
jgi:hypothetical protein